MTQTLTSTFDPPPPGEKLTVEQYHLMIDNGILEEGAPIELLDGALVRKDRAAMVGDPMSLGHHHMLAVKFLTEIDGRVRPFGCHMQAQMAVCLPPFDEPEPDGALLRGLPRDYSERKPGPADTLAVFEVADSSLRRDRTTKLQIYARANLPLYFIINLPERCIEQYTHPLPAAARFGQSNTFHPKQSITIPLPKKKSLKLPVNSLLP
jgi:hypothetical protein